MTNEELITLYGTAEPPVELQELRVGELSLMLEGGNLRYIRFEGIEVLRAVSFLVRDTRWGTYDAVLNNVNLKHTDDRFHFSYDATCSGPEGRYSYHAVVEGTATGHVSFGAKGISVKDFPTNRVGFVVLHPLAGVAGSSVKMEYVDGSAEQLVLSTDISPDQPATNIRAIEHRLMGLTIRVEMEGDAFEMEDHRNWTDASFKTYIRPLSKPRPFVIPAHIQLEQSVKVQITGCVHSKPAEARIPSLIVNSTGAALPEFGLGFDVIDESTQHLSSLKKLGANVLIARYDQMHQNNDALQSISDFATKLGIRVSLEAVIPGIDAFAELTALAQACSDANLKLASILVNPARDMKTRPSNNLPRGEASVVEIARSARAAFPETKIGGGMITSFTEFNRNRPPVGDIDFVSHSTCGNIHAADDVSVMETLEALDYVIRSTRKICGQLPYRIGPSAIGLRENPYGSSVAQNQLQQRITMARRDPRHRGLFGAAWTLAYIAVAARYGVELLTLAHGAGDFGVLNDDGSLRPIYHVLRGLARGFGAKSFNVDTRTKAIAAVGFAGKVRSEFWFSNTTAQSQSIDLQQTFQVARLDTLNFKDAASNPEFLERSQYVAKLLELRPFAIARVWPL